MRTKTITLNETELAILHNGLCTEEEVKADINDVRSMKAKSLLNEHRDMLIDLRNKLLNHSTDPEPLKK
jgi:hypothetical protein